MPVYKVIKRGKREKATVRSSDGSNISRRFCPSGRFVFDAKKVRLPAYIQIVITQELRQAMQDARRAASIAFKELRSLDEHYDQRFHYLCPIEPICRFENHCSSIDKIFGWQEKHGVEFPVPRIPAFVVNFYATEDAYDDFLSEHDLMKLDYLNGAYAGWRDQAQRFVDMVYLSGLSVVEKRAILMWWRGFMLEMRTWETRFEQMQLPSFEEVIDELSRKIEETVDVSNEWELFV